MATAIRLASPTSSVVRAVNAPIKLDPASPRGYFLDRYALIEVKARAAANAGTPYDPGRPPKEFGLWFGGDRVSDELRRSNDPRRQTWS